MRDLSHTSIFGDQIMHTPICCGSKNLAVGRTNHGPKRFSLLTIDTTCKQNGPKTGLILGAPANRSKFRSVKLRQFQRARVILFARCSM